ncbi:AAA family ATPase [Candidatus Woesearchaeota archaeon]|nr:AAA family ATPase [Candidatus Woesearchaeota archaeon]
MNWHEEHGFIEDPFGTGKGAFVQQAVNLNQPAEELIYNIEAGNMVLIQGSKGTGKTTLVFAAVDKFRGERKVIYFDCEKDQVDIKKLMQNKYGIIGKVFNLLPKGMVLMLDNFKSLSKRDIQLAKYYYDNNYLRSIVFSGNGIELPENIKDRIGSRIIKLKQLTAKDAVELVKNRVGSLEFLPEKIIKKIHAKSKDTAEFLKNCSSACQKAADEGAAQVSEKHLSGKNE